MATAVHGRCSPCTLLLVGLAVHILPAQGGAEAVMFLPSDSFSLLETQEVGP